MTWSGRPLLDNAPDMALFVDRDQEVGAVRSAVELGLNTLVTGEPGIGKSSLLARLAWVLRRQRRAPTSVLHLHARDIHDGSVLLDRLADELDVPAAGTGHAGALLRLRQLAQDRNSARTQVIVLDDVSADAGHEIFGRLRDELWSLGWVWIVAARDADRGALLLPPADAFFERRLNLAPLPQAAVGELLGRRATEDLPWAAEVAGHVAGNPRLVLSIGREVLLGGDARALLDATAHRDQAIQALGRAPMMLAYELQRLGAAAASDEALLSALGWTRPRAVQVLSELAEAGLVQSEAVRVGRGRPRRVFRLTPPVEYVADREALGASA